MIWWFLFKHFSLHPAVIWKSWVYSFNLETSLFLLSLVSSTILVDWIITKNSLQLWNTCGHLKHPSLLVNYMLFAKPSKIGQFDLNNGFCLLFRLSKWELPSSYSSQPSAFPSLQSSKPHLHVLSGILIFKRSLKRLLWQKIYLMQVIEMEATCIHFS